MLPVSYYHIEEPVAAVEAEEKNLFLLADIWIFSIHPFYEYPGEYFVITIVHIFKVKLHCYFFGFNAVLAIFSSFLGTIIWYLMVFPTHIHFTFFWLLQFCLPLGNCSFSFLAVLVRLPMQVFQLAMRKSIGSQSIDIDVVLEISEP